MSSFYRFTFSGTAVTSIQEFDDGVWKNDSIGRNEVWNYDPTTNTVTKTETERGRTKIKTYTDTDGDGVFLKASSASSLSGTGNANFSSSIKQYEFTIDPTTSAITAVRENENGYWHYERIKLNETWTYDAITDTVTKTESEHGYLETTTYARGSDGFFTRSSETYQLATGGTSLIDDSGSDDILYGYATVDRINSGDGDDYVESYGGNDILNGGNGNDYLYAGSGNDTVDGGAGDDMIVGGDGAGDDIYRGGVGVDTVKYTSATLAINVNLTSGKASGSEINNDKLYDIENVIGGDGSDVIVGSKVTNYLYGGIGNDNIDGAAGSDYLYGGIGNDTYRVDNVSDAVYEYSNEGTDTVQSSVSYTLSEYVENLTLLNSSNINATGNAQANTLLGNAGANTLSGGDGDDVIYGGLGKDTLVGGNGSDAFVFNTALSSRNVDRVVGYQDGVDKIYLEDAIFTKLRGDTNLSDNIVNGTRALDSNDYLIYNTSTGALVYDSNGSARGGEVTVATLGTGLTIDSSDFVLV